MAYKLFAFTALLLTQIFFSTYGFTAQPDKTIRPMFSMTAGQIGVFDSIEEPVLVGVEYQGNPFEVFKFDIIPSIGYMRSEGGSQYLFTTLRYDYWLDQKWVVTPIWGLGYFEDDNEIILGHELEFISGIEVAYEFENHHRLGLMFSHLSNAGLSSTNPGTETLVLSYSMPITD